MSAFVVRSRYALGDTVLLTGVIRDLKQRLGDTVTLDVRTPHPELWLHNPHLTPLDPYDPDVHLVEFHPSLVTHSNQTACHVLQGYLQFFEVFFGMPIRPTAFRGDIHLSPAERTEPSVVEKTIGRRVPYWLISSGGRWDLTTKWWPVWRFQEVVDHFQGKLFFVQVGARGDYHPALRGVLDLRGRTTVRDLVKLMYHADGVICGVTSLMHLAAAVPRPPGRRYDRPCVVVAGGLEPPSWEAYPGHQFLHAVGCLPCCAEGGCWRGRIWSHGTDPQRDRPDNMCVDVVQGVPRCMTLIRADDVIRAVEKYLEGGATRPLRTIEKRTVSRCVQRAPARTDWPEPLSPHNVQGAVEAFLESIPPYPGGFEGRGIVICAGGTRLFTNAWVTIRLLRHLGCKLPIELWHFGEQELDAAMRALVAPYGVRCVDALTASVPKGVPPRQARHGWALKAFALADCRFEEVLLLDADNMPARNPEDLFDSAPFRRHGAVFWPDVLDLTPQDPCWVAFGLRPRRTRAFESGQMLVRKSACWPALQLARWYNEHHDFFYRFVYGDKETFHMAWLKSGLRWAMPAHRVKLLQGAMLQHDFRGRVVFQHRNLSKWNLFGQNQPIRGFRFEPECRRFLKELRQVWDGRESVFLQRPTSAAKPKGRTTAVTANDPPLRIGVWMLSCAAREDARQATLRRWSQTDWAEPVQVVMDQNRFADARDRLTHTLWRAMQAAHQQGVDYMFCLEDDVDFNRYLRHNVFGWAPLQRREVALATLYNPGLSEVAAMVADDALIVLPQAWFGTQAVLLSRRFIEQVLERFHEGPPESDQKLAWHAARLQRPVYCHCPSLVQHLNVPSTWGGRPHQSVDFQRDWRAPGPSRPR